MDEPAARDVIGRFWQAVDQRDYETIRGLFAEDVLVEWPQSGETVRGKEACINIFANYPGGSPKLIGLRRILGRGDLWLSEAEMNYPDGKRWLTVSAIEFRDKQIVHEIDWFAEPFPAPEWRIEWVDQD